MDEHEMEQVIDGSLDDIMIFSKALTQAEVTALYNSDQAPA